MAYSFFSITSHCNELTQEEMARLQFIEDSFKKGEKKANYWQWGYFGLYAGGAVFNLIKYQGYKKEGPLDLEKKNQKFDTLINFGKATIGSLGLWFRPIIADRAYGQLKDLKNDKKKLNLAETLFTNTFKRVRGELSWKRRFAALAINSIGGFLIYNDGKRTKDALANFALGMIVSEIQIRTVPTRVLNDYKTYKKKFKIFGAQQALFQEIRVYPGVNSFHLSATF